MRLRLRLYASPDGWGNMTGCGAIRARCTGCTSPPPGVQHSERGSGDATEWRTGRRTIWWQGDRGRKARTAPVRSTSCAGPVAPAAAAGAAAFGISGN